MKTVSYSSSSEVIYPGHNCQITTKSYKIIAEDGAPIAVEHRSCVSESEPKAFIFAIHGFAQNRHTWCLPQISFANYMASKGYDFLAVDLRGSGLSKDFGSPPPKSIDEYHNDCKRVISVIIENIVKNRPLFLIGHSLGGALAYSLAPHFEKALSGIATFSAPYRFKKAIHFKYIPNFTLSAMADFFEKRKKAPLHTKEIGWLLAKTSVLFNNAYINMPLWSWSGGNMTDGAIKSRLAEGFDTTSGAILAGIFRFAATNRLQNGDGTVFYDDEFEKLNLPLLVCEADNDKLVPPGVASPAYFRSESGDKLYRLFGKPNDNASFGHIDIILGIDAPEIVWPFFLDWLDAKTK